jgi:ribose transport system permease protein
MTAAAPPVTPAARSNPAAALGNALRRDAWLGGLVGLFALLLIFTKIIQPNYGPSGIQGLALSVLPLALATLAQTVVVISGGIDLSIGSMMALTNCVAAVLMQNRSEEFGVGVAIAVLALGILIGAINGALIVATKVADIIVTLAMSFVWAGFALLVISAPGGDSSHWLVTLVTGPLVSEWVPRGLVVIVVIVAVVWLPIRRTRAGLALYAIGSNPLAAFRSGVSVGRTKIFAYALTGLFAGMAGLALTATTGQGSPLPGGYTLASVAAVVLGGVSLAGGRGGVVGPIVAVLILSLISSDMTFLSLNPNLATVVRGAILIGVVMLGSIATLRRKRT